MFAEELDGGEDVGAGRQQAAVAEGAEDAGVVGGGGAQVEELAFGGRDSAGQQFAQFVGAPVEVGDREPGGGSRVGARSAGGGSRLGARAAGCGGPGGALGRITRPGRSRGVREAQESGQARGSGEGRGGPVLGVVGRLGRVGGVGRAGGGEFRAGFRRGGLAGGLGGCAGGLAGLVPGGHGRLLRVGGGQGGARRVGVGGGVVEPAGPDGLGGLLLDLGEAGTQVLGLAAGPLGGRGRGGGRAVGGLAGLLEDGGALLFLVGGPLALFGGGVQGPYELGGGGGPGGERRGGVPLGFQDRGGDPGGAVGGGAVAQDVFGGLPGGVQGAGFEEFAALRGGGLVGDGQGQRGVPVGQFGRDGGAAGARGLGGGDLVGGAGDPLREVGGAAALLAGAGGQAPGEGARTAFGAGVDVAEPGAGRGGLDDLGEEVHGARGELPFGHQLGAAAEFVAEAVDEVGEAVRVSGVGDGAQQQVGEVGVLLDREEAGGLALVGVHLALVAEEFGVEADFGEVLVPAVVDLLEVHLEVRVRLAGFGQGVTEALHGAAPPLGAGGAFHGRAHRSGLGHREVVQAETRPGAEGVPGLGEFARVVGDLAAAPFADLADDHALAGLGVLPFQCHVAAVVGQQELAQDAGACAAQGVAVAGQHHREDQLEQDGLAAAVLEEEHPGGRGAARRAGGLVLEELRLGGRRVGHRLADSAQVEHGVGVARAGGPDGVEADPGQLVHGGGLSWSFVGRTGTGGGRASRVARAGGAVQAWKGRPASAASSRSSPSGGGSRLAEPSLTGTTPRSRSSAMAALPAMSRTWSW